MVELETTTRSQAPADSCIGEWVTIKPYHQILDLVSRVSARIFLGLDFCRDPRWLEISTQFTENGRSYPVRVLYTVGLRSNFSLCLSSYLTPLPHMDTQSNKLCTAIQLETAQLHQESKDSTRARNQSEI